MLASLNATHIPQSRFHHRSKEQSCRAIMKHHSGSRSIDPTSSLTFHMRLDYQSSSSSFFCMAFLRARRASAKLLPKLGVGVLLRLLSEPLAPFKLKPESRG